MALASQLTKEDRKKIADRINYFRVMPNQVLQNAADLERGVRPLHTDFVCHETKAVLVGGRVMLLNCN